jgi:hypothetical protein
MDIIQKNWPVTYKHVKVIKSKDGETIQTEGDWRDMTTKYNTQF